MATRDASSSPTRGWRGVIWGLAALAALLLFNLIWGLATDDLSLFAVKVVDGHLYGSLIDVLDQAAPVMLVALGMTIVIATGGVDLSVGAVMAIAGAVAAALLARSDLALPFVLALALGAGLLAGAWNGTLVALLGVEPIVATLVLMVAGRGAAQLLTRGQIVVFDSPALAFIGSGHLLGLPVSVWIVLGALAITAAITRMTALGLFIESVGDNETASRYTGVNVRGVKWFAYALTGLMAGVAGVLEAADIQAADANNVGLYLELDAILAVVIGGTALTGGRFHLLGALIGALIIQLAGTTIIMQGVPPEYALILKAIVVLAVCLLQSKSLRSIVAGRRVEL